MASDITIALISAGSALLGALAGSVGGIVGTMIAPWVDWRVQRRRRRDESRAKLIAQWRGEIRSLRDAEIGHHRLNAERKKNGEDGLPDPPETDPMHWRALERLMPLLSSWAKCFPNTGQR